MLPEKKGEKAGSGINNFACFAVGHSTSTY